MMRIIEGLRVGFRCRWSSRCVRTTPRSSPGSIGRRTGRYRRRARRLRLSTVLPLELEDGIVRAAFDIGEGPASGSPSPGTSPTRRPTGRGRRLGARPHGRGGVSGAGAAPTRVAIATSADLADRPQGDDLGDHRRPGRGADHLAAGGHRRRTQLGLPLLLAARLGARARGAARHRLHRGGTALPRLPASGRHG